MSLEWFQVARDATRMNMAALNGSMRCLVSGVDSGGRVTILEGWLQTSGGPPLHKHFDHDEFFLVIEGGPLTMQVGDRRLELLTGESLFIPRGTPHTYNNLSGRPIRVLGVHTPGGMEKELHEQAEYLLSVPEGERPDPARLAAIWKDNGAVVGPPIR
jgi:mannose-6-phosphate isomerase-like protein (cupin superfamily)